jgi:hypothetical protein
LDLIPLRFGKVLFPSTTLFIGTAIGGSDKQEAAAPLFTVSEEEGDGVLEKVKGAFGTDWLRRLVTS